MIILCISNKFVVVGKHADNNLHWKGMFTLEKITKFGRVRIFGYLLFGLDDFGLKL